jgi:PKD repeat protein
MRLKHPFCSILSLLWTLGLMSFLYIANAQAGQATLAWDANTEPTLGGYQLYYGQTSGNYTANVDVGKQTSYTLTGLTDGKTYYFAAKAYNIGKTVWSGFSNQVSKTISSTTAPVASFSASPTSGTAPLTVTFTDSSTGTINTNGWYWDFGNGTTSTAKNGGAVTYTNPGAYTAKLTVTGPGGSNTASKAISVAASAAPIANFSARPTSGTAPLAVTFTNSSTNATSYSWDFNGDGTTDSTAQNPSYTYTAAGTYTVKLTASGSGGTNTKTQTGYITVSSGGGTGGDNSGLVAAYNFEEATGTTVVDATGKGNHGTISGAGRTTSGKYGKALSFDGIDDLVTVKDSPSLDLTTGLTLEAWVYPTESMTDWRNVIAKEIPYGGVAYYLAANSSKSQPSFLTWDVDWNIALHGGPQLLPNTWAHLTATYDGTTARLYVNGTEVANQPWSSSIKVTDGVLHIGGNDTWGEFFKGLIDDVRVYNRALSVNEIKTDMNSSVGSGTGGGGNSRLVASYNFEEATGTTVVDASGQGNHGTINGAVRTTSGKYGKALSFDGVNDYVDLGSSILSSGASAFTIEAWVNRGDLGDDRVVCKSTGVYIPDHVFCLGVAGNGSKSIARARLSTSGGSGSYDSTASFPTNTWAHLAVTYDGSAVRHYINGQLAGTRSHTGSVIAFTQNTVIGNVNTVHDRYFFGKIDEVRIYNRALSVNEIQTDMQTQVR